MIDLAALPDHLLVPLLDSAGATLRALPADEVPPAARSLLSFDRRGMARGPARLQLRRALEREENFREQAFAEFIARSDVQAVLDDWGAGSVLALTNAATTEAGLALLASALVAAELPGADFGLGVVVAIDAMNRDARDDDEEAVEVTARIDELEERVRRVEAARGLLEQERDVIADQLRAERRSRREREDRAATETARAEARIVELEGEVERERARAVRAEDERARASERERSRSARAEIASARASERADALEAELQRFRNAAAAAAAAASAAEPVEGAQKGSVVRRGSGRRARPKLPGGLLVDSVSGADAMLRGPSVLLVVDGYNVSKTGWPNPSLEIERESLLSALHGLHLSKGTDVVVAFDGDGTQSFSKKGRPGVRVVFSKPGEEADSVVVETVSKTPLETPVVVASSDRWVREHAETFGAVVISAATLVAVLRKAPGRSAS